MIEAPNLRGGDDLCHGFFTRQGGLSEGAFESLNCGFSSGDDPERVLANRALAMKRLGLAPKSLATARQVHGTGVLVIDQATPGKPTVAADALVTTRRGIALGVLSADCAPVLFADPEGRVVGAAHAGWRGALAGVIEATIETMVREGAAPARIRAAIGPCIAKASYQVGPEFFAQFAYEDCGSETFFTEPGEGGRRQFDLEGYVLRRVERSGVRDAFALATDTFADEARFFSSRRTRKQGGFRFGLLLSAVALAP